MSTEAETGGGTNGSGGADEPERAASTSRAPTSIAWRSNLWLFLATAASVCLYESAFAQRAR